MRVEQRGKVLGVAARHTAFGGHAVDPHMALGGSETSCIAGHVIAVNETKIDLSCRMQLQPVKRCEKRIIGTWFWHWQVAELDRPLHTGRDRIDHLDHDPGVLRLDYV